MATAYTPTLMCRVISFWEETREFWRLEVCKSQGKETERYKKLAYSYQHSTFEDNALGFLKEKPTGNHLLIAPIMISAYVLLTLARWQVD